MIQVMLYLMILGPILVGAVVYIFSIKNYGKVLVIFQGLLVGAACRIFYIVVNKGVYVENIGGWPDYIAITLRADRLGIFMVLMVTAIYFVLLLFGYHKEHFSSLFGFLFMILQGLMIGLFLSNDLFNIFIFIEVSTVVISILIMFNKDKQAIYDGMIYFLVNVVASIFFLFGIAHMYKTFGILDFKGIESAMTSIKNSSSVILPYAFMMTTISLKTALMPLFSWLPKAHGTPSAPSVVSAVLSGLYVKSGLYLFIRLQQVFYIHIDMHRLFFLIGFLTAVIGFMLALSQKDIKLILAYHTVSQIGLIMMGINMGNTTAYWGGIYHIFSHALFKTTLFLTAGILIDDYGTRNVYEIRGVFRRMPSIATAIILAIMGITGAPFFNGSISKYLIAYGSDETFVQAALLFVNMGTILSFVKFSGILFGDDKRGSTSIDVLSNTVVLFMGFACLLGGVFGQQLIKYLFDYQVTIDVLSYINKAIIFVAMLVIGIVVYHGIIKKTNWLNKLYQIELSFNGICTAITIYFIVLLTYLKFKC